MGAIATPYQNSLKESVLKKLFNAIVIVPIAPIIQNGYYGSYGQYNYSYFY